MGSSGVWYSLKPRTISMTSWFPAGRPVASGTVAANSPSCQAPASMRHASVGFGAWFNETSNRALTPVPEKVATTWLPVLTVMARSASRFHRP